MCKITLQMKDQYKKHEQYGDGSGVLPDAGEYFSMHKQ
jgi:hypothetical protein